MTLSGKADARLLLSMVGSGKPLVRFMASELMLKSGLLARIVEGRHLNLLIRAHK